MLLFQFTAEQRGEFFHTAGVLLEHDATNHRWLPQQMWPCRTAVLVYRDLMKTWHPSRLESVLWGSQLMHVKTNLQMSSLSMVWGMLG